MSQCLGRAPPGRYECSSFENASRSWGWAERSRAEQDLLQTSSPIQLLAPNDRVDHRLTAAVGKVFFKELLALENCCQCSLVYPHICCCWCCCWCWWSWCRSFDSRWYEIWYFLTQDKDSTQLYCQFCHSWYTLKSIEAKSFTSRSLSFLCDWSRDSLCGSTQVAFAWNIPDIPVGQRLMESQWLQEGKVMIMWLLCHAKGI